MAITSFTFETRFKIGKFKDLKICSIDYIEKLRDSMIVKWIVNCLALSTTNLNI
jgi:hypothetical protein